MRAEFAGTLTQRVTLSRLSEERTESGLSESRWEVFASCLASVVPEGAGAEAEGMTLSGMPRYRVVLRSRADVRVEQRVSWRGRQFLVKQLLDDPRLPDRIELRCEEVRA